MGLVERFVVVACAVVMSTAASAQSADQEPRWYVIADRDGAVLGHASSESERGAAGRRVVDRQQIYVREQGGASTRSETETVTIEDSAGAVLSIVETSRTRRFQSRLEAHVAGDRVEIARETPSGRWTQVVDLAPGTRFDHGEALLRSWDPAVTPRLEFDAFSIDAMGVEHVVIEPVEQRAGGGMVVLRRRYDGANLRGLARLTLDADRRVVETVQPMVGTTLHIRAVDRAEALRPHPPYAIVPNSMIRSPFVVSNTARRGHIRYRFSFEQSFQFAPPQTGEQRVTLESDTVTVDICETCGPGLPADADALADARRATAWLQSDHPRLRALAAPIAALDVSEARKMELLLERARPYLERIDFNGHYSALDTLARRAGDCTEAAVLLAALGRAAGIPTRVASGLAYSRQAYHGVSNAFMPHSWVLAYVDGRWRSFDLALGEFDATHIALTIGDGDANAVAAASQLASLLRFDAMAEVRSRE